MKTSSCVCFMYDLGCASESISYHLLFSLYDDLRPISATTLLYHNIVCVNMSARYFFAGQFFVLHVQEKFF